jgi:predicted nucleic acid-binding protein
VIVLDTNVVSELMRQEPAASVLAWVDQHPTDDVYITAVTAAELQYGVARLPAGRRRKTLMIKVAELLSEDFRDQILPFGLGAAAHYAEVAALREREGRPISMADALIAGICRHVNAHLATRNVKDFADTGVQVIDPWHAGEPT